LLTGGLPPTTGFGAGLPAAVLAVDAVAALLVAGAAFATGLAAGLGAGFFGGGALVFDFAAVFDGITILLPASEAAHSHNGQRGCSRSLKRFAAGSLGSGSLSPN